MKVYVLLVCCVVTILAYNERVEEFTGANNKFAVTLYKELCKTESGNLIVSPFSVGIILSLVISGSQNETGNEIRNVINFSGDKERTEEAVNTLRETLYNNESYTLYTLNRIYLREDINLNEDFEQKLYAVYGAGVENINFDNTEEAAKIINDWTSESTFDKIKNIIDAEVIDNNTKIILLNALYFQALWQQPFYLALTNKISFYTPADVIEVDAMQNVYGQHFFYYECLALNAKFLELPFKNDSSMTIVLPIDKEGLPFLEDHIHKLITPHNFTRERVELAIPKFKFETYIDLKRILKNLGVNTVFTDFAADLSLIAGEKGDLTVSEMVQKSFIEINEEGIEAAAAVSVSVLHPKSIHVNPPKEFIVDHPFIFYIKVKDVLMYVGRVTDPSTSSSLT